MKLQFENVNTNKLHDELIAAGIVPQLVESLEGITWITVDESEEEAVHEVVARHNPVIEPILPPPTTEERVAAIEEVLIMLI